MKHAFTIAVCFAELLLTAACGSNRALAAGAPHEPNIILILADDLGYGDLGCYGQKAIRTPQIDRMAAEGMRFTDCYAGSAVCAPSRCCLMTGLHSGHASVRGNHEVQPMGQLPLPADTVTVAGVLQHAGYATAMVGKWGLGGPDSSGAPNKQGFDYFYGYLCQRHAHNSYPDFLFRNNLKVQLGNEVSHTIGGRDVSPSGVATKRVAHSNDLFSEESLALVEKHKNDRFFLYLPYTLPHANNETNSMEVPDFGPYANQKWPESQKGYAAAVTRLDGYVGKLLAKLEELGIDQKTIVFFTGDNGPHKEGGVDPKFFHSSGPFRQYKGSLYEGGIRVPMIAHWPGHIKPGTSSDLAWAFWDFFPTAAELAGAKTPPALDGLSIVPTLLGRDGQEKRDFLYWEFNIWWPEMKRSTTAQAVRMGSWKGVRLSPNWPIQLYDLASDIAEAHDVAADHPDLVEKIVAHFKTAHTDSTQWPLKLAR